jgi:ABC-type multidrug transport system ATPase subunit
VTSTYSYLIIQNKTNSLKNIFSDYTMPQPLNPVTLSLKVQVDQILASYVQGKPVSLNVSIRPYPSTSSRYF